MVGSVLTSLTDHDMNHPPKLERWERIERYLLVVAAALLIGAPIVRFVLGYGGLVQFLLTPFGLWCIWQAFYEDRLDDNTPPSKMEQLFAFSWLWARRLVVGGVGVVFLALGIDGILHPLPGDAWGILAAFLIGIFALWVAFYGGGRRAYGVDIVEVFRRRKERYKWTL